MDDAQTLSIKLRVNGRDWQGNVPANRLLVDLLRYDCLLYTSPSPRDS